MCYLKKTTYIFEEMNVNILNAHRKDYVRLLLSFKFGKVVKA